MQTSKVAYQQEKHLWKATFQLKKGLIVPHVKFKKITIKQFNPPQKNESQTLDELLLDCIYSRYFPLAPSLFHVHHFPSAFSILRTLSLKISPCDTLKDEFTQIFRQVLIFVIEKDFFHDPHIVMIVNPPVITTGEFKPPLCFRQNSFQGLKNKKESHSLQSANDVEKLINYFHGKTDQKNFETVSSQSNFTACEEFHLLNRLLRD